MLIITGIMADKVGMLECRLKEKLSQIDGGGIGVIWNGKGLKCGEKLSKSKSILIDSAVSIGITYSEI
jgi:hypothetical protein